MGFAICQAFLFLKFGGDVPPPPPLPGYSPPPPARSTDPRPRATHAQPTAHRPRTHSHSPTDARQAARPQTPRTALPIPPGYHSPALNRSRLYCPFLNVSRVARASSTAPRRYVKMYRFCNPLKARKNIFQNSLKIVLQYVNTCVILLP